MAVNYKQVYAKKQATIKKILEICPNIPRSSGIYVFHRIDENGIKYAYVGQAKHLLDRCASHLLGYQHIDLSLKKHGLKSTDNPYGYELHYFNYEENVLDEMERKYINKCAREGWQLRNATLGGQDSGKVIIEQKAAKGYRDGLAQGYKNAKKEIVELFAKYLVAQIDGKPNKIKERKLNEFKEWLKNEDSRE